MVNKAIEVSKNEQQEKFFEVISASRQELVRVVSNTDDLSFT